MGQLQQNNDKRTFLRTSREVFAEVKKFSSPPEEPGEKGMSRDISGGGMCLTVSAPYEPETGVRLKFNIPARQSHKKQLSSPLVIIGKVAWCRERPGDSGYDIGIEFRPRSFADAKKIYSTLYPYVMSLIS
ncbi:PilZ domain-containing protein [Desulfonema magnum]|uniref:PilZ domain-containing protein n=1 Tax=Desulfonema magnum TaxID=45655 RepID=A0A975BRQ0_9BACT|nr:PilZ domain-containing protein [Desulfonema magnum]QTA90212.1 PilZ domain-containing protein [Desulfonema magnum]